MNNLERRLGAILDRHVGWTCTAAVIRVDGPQPLVVSHGILNPGIDARAATPDTPFDLASLTKLFTSAAALRCVASATLQLDDPVSRYLRLAGTGADGVTVRRILTHSSGLPALAHLWDRPRLNPHDAIVRTNAVYAADTRVVYSDVGFIMLGFLLERVMGAPLAHVIDSLVAAPLGLGVAYGPQADAAATELDPWRGRRLQGEVHDENAFVLGGRAGHAGLFGSASAVAGLARAFLHPEGFLPQPFAAAAVREWIAWEDERRGLGWKLRSPNSVAPEASLPPTAFGHTGYTGTAVWAVPSHDTVVTILTNRVYYSRSPAPIRALRREILDAVAQELLAGS